MSLFDTLSAYFSSEKPADPPAGLCINCWGYEEWDGKIRDLAAEKQVELRDSQERENFIGKVVVQAVEGITLAQGKHGTYCKTCKAREIAGS